MATRFKFRHVNELNGLFVLAVFALVVAGAIFSGHSQRWFTRKFAFDVLLPKAGTSGLRQGDEVFILGVSAGLVDDIIVGEDGRVKAHVKIRRDFERFVRADSTASIQKTFVLGGDSFMEITQGTGEPLNGGAPALICLPSEDSFGRIEKMLADVEAELIPVMKKAGAGLDEWTKLGADLQKAREQLSGLVTRLDILVSGVEEGKGTAGKLLNDSALADNAQELLARANQTISQLQGVVTTLSGAVENVQNGTVRLPEITDAVANETKHLPGLVAQTQTSMRELERLVEALQRTWLVRKYVDHTYPPSWHPQTETGKPDQTPVKSVHSPKDSK
jgi:phospholipid/cholesterol/gamma-HCH transport system substrate-binding protein